MLETAPLLPLSGKSGNRPTSRAGLARVIAFTHPTDNDRLTDEIYRALHTTGYLQLRGLDVVADDGSVVLRGKVPSYYSKQLAQTAAMAVAGVSELHNELQVVCCQ